MTTQGSENERRTICNSERRQAGDRRQANFGAPAGMCERRVNIERRLFNLDVRCFVAWLEKPPGRDVAQGAPVVG